MHNRGVEGRNIDYYTNCRLSEHNLIIFTNEYYWFRVHKHANKFFLGQVIKKSSFYQSTFPGIPLGKGQIRVYCHVHEQERTIIPSDHTFCKSYDDEICLMKCYELCQVMLY